MKFITNSHDAADRAYDALLFLRNAYDAGKIGEIENMEDVFDALDISGELELAQKRLKQYHIDD